jgi:hypothetical protein
MGEVGCKLLERKGTHAEVINGAGEGMMNSLKINNYNCIGR